MKKRIVLLVAAALTALSVAGAAVAAKAMEAPGGVTKIT